MAVAAGGVFSRGSSSHSDKTLSFVTEVPSPTDASSHTNPDPDHVEGTDICKDCTSCRGRGWHDQFPRDR